MKQGTQSEIGVRWDLMPFRALIAAAGVMAEGAERYGVMGQNGQLTSWPNLRSIPVDSHLNHAVQHLFMWLGGDRSEDHLGHAAVRVLVAKELETEGKNK